MKYPPGHTEVGTNGKDKVYLVQKPIYSLRQAGRRFQRDFFAWLKLPIDQGGAGFTRSEKELCTSSRAASATPQCTQASTAMTVSPSSATTTSARCTTASAWRCTPAGRREDEGELSNILNGPFASHMKAPASNSPNLRTSTPWWTATYYPMTSRRPQATKVQKTPLIRYTSRTTSRPHLPPRQQPTRHRTLPYSPNTSL